MSYPIDEYSHDDKIQGDIFKKSALSPRVRTKWVSLDWAGTESGFAGVWGGSENNYPLRRVQEIPLDPVASTPQQGLGSPALKGVPTKVKREPRFYLQPDQSNLVFDTQFTNSTTHSQSLSGELCQTYDTVDIVSPYQIPESAHPTSSQIDLSGPSYTSPLIKDDLESMYTSFHTHCSPDISLHSGHLLSAASNVLSHTGSMNMFPHGNRQDGAFHSQQQAQWSQYQRSLSSTPEDPYQRRSQGSMTPPAGYASLQSQPTVIYANTSYPLNMQQPLQQQPAQAFYPTSAPYGFNQPGYEFPPTSFVSSNTYSTTAGPSLGMPIRATSYMSGADSPPNTNASVASTTGSEPESQVRVLESRPKPQCWDHGCNGREFSTFSNLLRHQRERSGAAAKSECPHCGAVFTRTTARNTHIAQGKCKGIRDSTEQ